jgi:aspartyl-tRNA(Asn)/glutamyl-tRNA(Gln) amidotransferase subunit C
MAKGSKFELSKEEVLRLANLARIELSRKEVDIFAKQLSQILEYFRKIDEVNVSNVKPTYHVIELKNVWRDDKAKGFDSDSLIKIVPKRKGRFIKAPRMV